MALPVMLDKENVAIIWNDRISLLAVFMVFKYSGLFSAHITIIYHLKGLTSFKKSL